MKRFLFIVLVLCAHGAFGYSDLNKTPKSVRWADACDECQMIIKRIVDVATDPTKVAELKLLLSALCQETSYVDECRLFVNKLDLFLDRLLPYLKNAHHVCKELHICDNNRLEQFHLLGMHYVRVNASFQRKDLICEECQLAAHELAREINVPKFQQDVEEWLQQNICAHFGSLKASCEQLLDDFLPEMWKELADMLGDQKKFCQDLELCPTYAGGYIRSPSSFRRLKSQFASSSMGSSDSRCPCFGHKLSINTFRLVFDHYVQNDFNTGPCALLTNGNDFCRNLIAGGIHSLVDEIMHLRLIQITRLKQICEWKQSRMLGFLRRATSKLHCDICRAITKLLEVELGKPKVQEELIDALERHFCDRIRSSDYAICVSVVKSYFPLVLTQIVQQLQRNELCHLAHVCPKPQK
uniref:Saposin B-type domain-containing protein n=1 Tax=Globodera rostochiensis TaxID=31243 RepID=A0A914GU05_GLORO